MSAANASTRRRFSLSRLVPARGSLRTSEADVATRGAWARACAAAWVVMAGALLAASPVLADNTFTVKLAAVLVIGLPICFFVHGSRLSRLAVNLSVFGASVTLGALELATHWPYQANSESLVGPLALLLRFFLWVMVFRSVAVRTLTDAVQTAIPAISVLLLVLIVQPEPLALLGVALVALGTIALLAQEHQALADAASDAITRVRLRTARDGRVRRRRVASLYSWPTLYVAVMIAAIATGIAASYLHFSSQLGQDIQIMLARRLAQFMMRDSYGYTPESRVVLDGRTPRNSDHVLFRVKGDIPVNWRTTAHEKYNGRTWSRYRYRGTRATAAADTWIIDPSTMAGFSVASTTPTSYEFTADAPLGGSLPTAIWPTKLTADIRGVRTDDVGTLLITGYIMPGQQYRINALVPSLAPVSVSAAKPVLPPEASAHNLEVPDFVPARVRELAQSIVASEETPLGQASAIQSYLQTGYPYDLSPPTPQPGDDFVDHFLFIGKRGYCHHFASAMVILCRCVGLPARFAVGFTEGEYDGVHDRYIVREKDMHSWPEVFIPDRGWIPFEPTPPEDERNKSAFATAWKSLTQSVGGAAQAVGGYFAQRSGLLVVALVCIVAASTSAGMASHRRRWAVRPPSRQAGARERCLFTYRQMRRWLASRGQPGSPSSAPLEYLADLRSDHTDLAPDAQTITEAYLGARFSSREVPAGRATEAEEALLRVREVLRRKADRGNPPVEGAEA